MEKVSAPVRFAGRNERSLISSVIGGLISLEDTWADYQKTLKEMGIDELISIYQAAYARATAN